ncbi:MAG: TolC family protein [Verrucomicrobiota bacterium]
MRYRLRTLLYLSSLWLLSPSHAAEELAARDPDVAGTLVVRYPEEVFPELRRLLEVAVERAPELRAEAARIDEQEGRAMTETARANSFVSLSGRLLGGYEQRFRLDSVEGQDRTDGEPVATIDAGLWWQKPLFAWGNLERYAQLGELGVKASELNFAEAARVHLNEVRSTFIQWQLAEAQLRLLEENVAVAVRIVEAQEQLLEIGRISEQRVLELRARLLEIEENRALQERDRQYLRDRLAVLVGDPALVATIGSIELPRISLPEGGEDAWRAALRDPAASRPGLDREQRLVAIDALRAEIAGLEQRPTIDLVAGVSTNRVDTDDISDNTLRAVGYIGLQVRWNLFDGRRSEGEQIAALARVRAREARLEVARARVRDEGARLAANLRYFRDQAQARAQRAELHARRLELTEDPAGEDRISPLDRLELRLDYLRSAQSVETAKANYLMTMAQLAALIFTDPVAGL